MTAAELAGVIESIKQTCRDGLRSPHLVDLALIGNASDVYAWMPTPNVDLDVCFIVRALEPDCGNWLLEQARHMASHAARAGIPFELRIINGPYKPTPDRPAGPAIVLHGAVFTESTYRLQPALLRWSWRKYKCVVVAERLAEWAPDRPGARELLNGALGIRKRLAAIDAGAAVFYEQLLPSFQWTEFAAAAGDNLFTEYCFAAVADSARNHGRVLGRPEADSLSNEDYTEWYSGHVFHRPSFPEAMRLKLHARQNGYEGLGANARRLARDFLGALCAHLET